MKLFFFVIIVLFSGFLLIRPYGANFPDALNNFVRYSPCDKPVYFKIGAIDKGFSITSGELENKAVEAANVWNAAFGKNLVEFSPEGEISLNLVFDRRQELTTEINSKEGKIDSERSVLDARQSQFEADAAIFEQKTEAFKNEVRKWNSQGGAPQDVYEKLINDQSNLRSEADRLNSEARTLRITASKFNNSVNDLNSSINSFNSILAVRPEEGLYSSTDSKIDIYFYTNETEFFHTLIHEFGHAIGLGHTESQDSLMYPYTTMVIKPNREDIDMLTEYCRPKDLVERFKNKLTLIVDDLVALSTQSGILSQ